MLHRPPEVNRDFAYAVTGVNAPFVTPQTDSFGSNRFGSLTRNSDASTVNGRFGQPPSLPTKMPHTRVVPPAARCL